MEDGVLRKWGTETDGGALEVCHKEICLVIENGALQMESNVETGR